MNWRSQIFIQCTSDLLLHVNPSNFSCFASYLNNKQKPDLLFLMILLGWPGGFCYLDLHHSGGCLLLEGQLEGPTPRWQMVLAVSWVTSGLHMTSFLQ